MFFVQRFEFTEIPGCVLRLWNKFKIIYVKIWNTWGVTSEYYDFWGQRNSALNFRLSCRSYDMEMQIKFMFIRFIGQDFMRVTTVSRSSRMNNNQRLIIYCIKLLCLLRIPCFVIPIVVLLVMHTKGSCACKILIQKLFGLVRWYTSTK